MFPISKNGFENFFCMIIHSYILFCKVSRRKKKKLFWHLLKQQGFIRDYYKKCQDYHNRGEKSSSIPNTAKTTRNVYIANKQKAGRRGWPMNEKLLRGYIKGRAFLLNWLIRIIAEGKPRWSDIRDEEFDQIWMVIL